MGGERQNNMSGKRRSERTTTILVAAALLLLAANISQAKYSGGTGEPNDPYRIATPNDLNDIGNHIEDFNKCFVMVNDINLTDYTGTQFNIIGCYYGFEDSNNRPFTGAFDGNGHTVLNFAYECNDVNCIGLLRLVEGPNSQIANVTLLNPDVNAGTGKYVGALVGFINDATITSCAVVGGNVAARTFVGGLVGIGLDGITNDSFSTASVRGTSSVGGLIGFSGGGVISDSHSTGTVSGLTYVGGLVGRSGGQSITSCYATGDVGGNWRTGGLVGDSQSSIQYCWASGTVSGTSGDVGGLVGCTTFSENTIQDCCSSGTVTGEGSNVGGLVGHAYGGSIINCSAIGTISGDYRVGGLVGSMDADSPTEGEIHSCSSSGNVYGNSSVGGLVGRIEYIDLSECSSTGTVTATGHYVGGLAGMNSGEMTNSYATGVVDGNSYMGGFVGYSSGGYTACFWDTDTNPDVNGIGNTTDPNVIPRTTAEMQTQSTFTDAGWDFVEVWGIGENQTYPFLRVHPAGDLDHDGIVDWRDFAILAGHWLQGVE
jgi:hypothetical protein